MKLRNSISTRLACTLLAGGLALAPLSALADDATGSDAPIDPVPADPIESDRKGNLDNGINFDHGNGELVEVVAPDGVVVEVPHEVAHDDTIEVTPHGLLVSEPPTYGPHLPHHILDDHFDNDTAGSTAADGSATQESPPASQAFDLHSNPGADLLIYLDFTGHTTTNTPWNSGTRPDSFTSAPYAASNPDNTASYIVKVWEMVAEDFAPFDVDVTTEEPALDDLRRDNLADERYGIRVVISPTDEWYGSSGGVAYINSMRWTDGPSEGRTPAFVFSGNLGGGYWKYVAEATSHEVGHTLGLYHDGTQELGYYQGHWDSADRRGSGWAPIMGAGYNVTHTQWSKGDYPGANQTQDDLAIIFSRLGARDDAAQATSPILDHDDSTIGAIGTGGSATEFDVRVGAGPLSIDIEPTVANGNLFARAELLNGSTVIASTAPSQPKNWSMTLGDDVDQGTYTLRVTSTGYLTPANGFTSYGSIGEFAITVAGVQFDEGTGTTTSTTTSTTSTTVPDTTTTTTVPDTTTTSTTTTTTTTTTVPSTTTTTSTTVPSTTSTTTTTTPPTTVPPTVPPTTQPPQPEQPDADDGDRLTAIQPVRLLDTRFGIGGALRVLPGSTTRVTVAGHPAISSTATSAVLNVVAVDPGAAGYLQITPCLNVKAKDRTASVAFDADATIGNSTIAKLDNSGDVCVFSLVATDIVIDATGWIGPDGDSGLHVDTPSRVVDTRFAVGLDRRLAAGQTAQVSLANDVPAGTTAAAINLTAVDAAGPGFITTFPCGGKLPKVSSLNFDGKVNRGNNAIVALGSDRSFCVYSPTATDLVIDLTGSFSSGGLEFIAADPVRVLDSRNGIKRLASGDLAGFQVPRTPGGDHAVAASMVITVVDQTAAGFVTSWSCGKQPDTVAVVAVPGEANANGAIAALTSTSRSCLFTRNAANIVVDFSGWWV